MGPPESSSGSVPALHVREECPVRAVSAAPPGTGHHHRTKYLWRWSPVALAVLPILPILALQYTSFKVATSRSFIHVLKICDTRGVFSVIILIVLMFHGFQSATHRVRQSTMLGHLLLVSALAALCHAGADEAVSAMDLNNDNFVSQVSGSPHFVMFFAPWSDITKAATEG